MKQSDVSLDRAQLMKTFVLVMSLLVVGLVPSGVTNCTGRGG